MTGLKFELHNLTKKTNYIHVTQHCYFPKIANFVTKEKLEGSNHFKVCILDSLIYNFDPLALDGTKCPSIHLQEIILNKKPKKIKICLERFIFDECWQPCSKFLGI